jgi:cytochrome c oxidase subunit 4
MTAALRRNLVVWLALLVLLAGTAASAFVPLGAWNGVLNLVIAGLKLALVAVFFMHVAAGHTAIRLSAVIGCLMLGLLFGLSGADYVTRQRFPAPWQEPRQLPAVVPGHPPAAEP